MSEMDGNGGQILVLLADIRDSTRDTATRVGRVEEKLDALVNVVTKSFTRRIDDHERRLRRLEARKK